MENNQLYDELLKNFRDLHQAQLKSSGLPEIYWNSLFEKIKDEIFDAGDYFQICMRVDEDDNVIGYKAICIKEDGLKTDNPNGVFLIDHAWTYRVNDARQNLMDHASLLNRMSILMSITVDEEEDPEVVKTKKVEAVLQNMWRFNQTYKIATEKLTDEEREPLWYIMDEFGSSLRHNDNPTVKCVPFYYIPTATMYSIIWPVSDLEHGDEITRDYVYGIKDEKVRKAKLFPWNDEDEEYLESLDEEDPTHQDEPGIEYFNSCRQNETLPPESDLELVDVSKLNLNINNNNLINVYTDMKSIQDNLTDSKFRFVDDLWKADIIFMKKHFKDYKALREKCPNTLINQFPFENAVTVKDLMAIVCRRVPDSKKWLPITYNLAYELPKFIKYYKQREEEGLDNHWILKPWNLARSIDTTVTKNLNQIIRSQETGPKISCKYITEPVLFYRDELKGSVKFDVRYIVLVRSIKPLIIYTYNVFWLRFANKPYSLENLEDYEKHFTVMNYKPTVVLKQIHYNEFIPLFEEQNPNHKWTDLQEKIFKMIRQVFEGASKEQPPKGIAHNYQSRAMYAVDLMLDWRTNESGDKTIEPMICEVNFMPDCSRACKYHPSFFNDIFNTLFLDCLDHKNVTTI